MMGVTVGILLRWRGDLERREIGRGAGLRRPWI